MAAHDCDEYLQNVKWKTSSTTTLRKATRLLPQERHRLCCEKRHRAQVADIYVGFCSRSGLRLESAMRFTPRLHTSTPSRSCLKWMQQKRSRSGAGVMRRFSRGNTT